MSSKQHDEFGDGIGDEVEKFLRSVHGTEEESPKDNSAGKKGEGRSSTPQYSESYEEVKVALEKIFEMCDRHGFSIQVAISDEPLNERGEQGQRITICGHMSPDNIPCEMVAAAAIYQSHHLFSHMVLAMASAGMPLITNTEEDDEEDE